jgi:hypothetical protein
VEAEVTGFDGHDHLVGGLEGVERQQADARRAVDDAPLVGMADLLECLRQPVVAARAAGEDLIERGEADVRRGKVEVGGDLPDDLAHAARRAVAGLDEGVVDRALDLLVGHGQADGTVALWVHVDQQGLVAEARHAGSEVDAGGGLPAATFLIHDRDGSHGKPSLVELGRVGP